MMKLIMPVILIGVSVAIFLVVSNPMYSSMGGLRTELASYNDALGNSKALENAKDQLTTKENAIDPNNLELLKKLLPDHIDNIRLILEIEDIAKPFNMTLKGIQYDANTSTAPAATAVQGGAISPAAGPGFGTWNMSFTTTSTYDTFLNFAKALQDNLRIVDIMSVQFSSSGGSGGSVISQNSSEVYTYSVKIRTYWLK